MFRIAAILSVASIALMPAAHADVVIDAKSIVQDGDVVRFIVKITNSGENEIDLVIVTCTVFDENHEPLGTGSESVQHLKPKETVYDTALVRVIYGGRPTMAACRLDN